MTPRRPTSTSHRTSTTDPIGMGWLESRVAGKVGLTFAPGKHQASKSGSPWKRDLEMDLDHLRQHHEADVLVCLLEDQELDWLKIPALVEEARQRGLIVHRLPIPDGGVLPALEPVHALVEQIDEHARAGRNVVIHCAGGLGRSGTVGGCWLVHQGHDAAEALGLLRKARGKNCPETEGQRTFIARYSDRYAARPGVAPLTSPDPQSPPGPPPSAPCQEDSTAPTLQDRMLGAVLGAAIGDAMGHPTEFLKSYEAIRAKYGPCGVLGYALTWQRDGKSFAPYTDDTQMAELVLRVITESKALGVDLDGAMQELADAFVGWARHPQGGHRAPGNACLAGCRALENGVHWSEAGGATAGGCGSVMRAYPFGVVFHDDLHKAEHWAVKHSKLTHRDPIALAACAAMAVGVAHQLHGATVDETASAMVAAASRYDEKTAAMLAKAVQRGKLPGSPEASLTRLLGWAAHEAIAAGLYVFVRHADDPVAAILEAANSPGDSDSIATIAGALVGARCGVAALPLRWIEDLERSDELRALALSM